MQAVNYSAFRRDLWGLMSRRIDEKNRLVYEVEGDTVRIYSCRDRYGDR